MRKLLIVFNCLLMLACNGVVAEGQQVASADGEALFVEKCGMCHREGGMGTGILGRRLEGELALLENRDDLAEPYIKVVVRNGLRTMFPLSRAEVSDPQLDGIAAYLAGEQD